MSFGKGGLLVIPPNFSFLCFGANSVAATTTTRFLWPWYEDNLAPLSPILYEVKSNFIISNLTIRHNNPNGNGNLITYTLRKNLIATLLVVNLASTGITASDIINSVSFSAGDLIDLQVTKALGVGTSPTDITASMRAMSS